MQSPAAALASRFATAQPASLLGIHATLARLARAAGATIDDADDTGPLRVDGRTGRFLRWLDGIAVVSDGSSLLATSGPDAAEEWMFLAGRPSLVVADGPFAVAAVDAGVEVVAFAGLDRVELAVPAVRTRAQHGNGCLVVPVHGGRARSGTRRSSRCSNVRTRKVPATAAPSSEPHRHREARSTTCSAATYGHGPSGRSRESAWGRS